MKRLATIGAVLALAAGMMATAPQQAEARRGGAVAGIVVGAIIGGLIAREISRSHRRRYYTHSYAYRPYRTYRSYDYYGCSGWRCY